MALRLVSQNTKRIEIGDEDYIVVKQDISRRDFNRIITTLPQGMDLERGIDFATANAFAEGLFEVFVTDWSVVGDDNVPVPPTVENYQMLSRQAATLIDEAITTHFNAMNPTDDEAVKSEGHSEE